MPELPEVQTVASELNRKLKNRKIKSVVIHASKVVGFGPAVLSPIRKTASAVVKKFKTVMRGQKFLSVRRRAKLLIFDLSGPWSMLGHLKMTGQFIFEDKALRKKTGGKYRLLNKLSAPLVPLPAKHTHVVFYFFDGSTLYFNDVRKFGYLKLVHDGEIKQVKELQEFGTEPLSKEFTCLLFFTAVKKSKQRKIKDVLMDQTVIAGIGNIYSDEILFLSGVRPERKVSSIKYNELREIHKNIKKVLIRAVKAKGSSVGDFIRTDGSWGKMGKYHFVYGREGQKCKKCGSIILSVKMNGRTASYCPSCQR